MTTLVVIVVLSATLWILTGLIVQRVLVAGRYIPPELSAMVIEVAFWPVVIAIFAVYYWHTLTRRIRGALEALPGKMASSMLREE